MPIHELLSYRHLLLDPQPQPNNPVRWLAQAYGNSRALGFKGSPAYIRLCANLFINYDWRPARVAVDNPAVLVRPASIELKRHHDVVHLVADDVLIYETLINYFKTAIPHFNDVKVSRHINHDDPDDITYECDEREVVRLAIAAATHFMEHQIEVSSFLIEPEASILIEHSMGLHPVAE